MIFSHLRWIPTPSPIFSTNLEELRGPSFSTQGATVPPLAPLPAPLDIVVVNKGERKCIIIDIAVPGDTMTSNKEKIEK